jgi:hypothetical protein
MISQSIAEMENPPMKKDFSEFPPERRAKILEMRAKIAANDPSIEDKLDIAVDRLLDDLQGNYIHPSHQQRPVLVVS